MKTDIIYNKSSEVMNEINDKSVDLMVTSPPYNIDISYGNKWKGGKILESKGSKYHDSIEEEQYRNLLNKIFCETKRVLKDDGQLWVNIKNRYSNDQLEPPFWVMD